MPLLPQSVRNYEIEANWIRDVMAQRDKFFASYRPESKWIGHVETGVWPSDTAEKTLERFENVFGWKAKKKKK